jgi:HSP20 family molecular chaperone IbpA
MSLFSYKPYEPINNISNPLLNYIIYYPSVFVDQAKINDNEYVYTVEMPGMSKDDVSVTISKDFIMVEGVRRTEEDEIKVVRKYNFPSDGDEDGVTAKIKNGLLKIIVPRLNQNTTRVITIQ